jgi:hypothetical protein
MYDHAVAALSAALNAKSPERSLRAFFGVRPMPISIGSR